MAANHPSISVPLTFVLYIICYTFSGNPSIFPLQCIQTTHHVQTTGENEIQCENVNNHGKWAMTGEWTWWYRWGIYFEHIWTRSDYWAEKGGGERKRERKSLSWVLNCFDCTTTLFAPAFEVRLYILNFHLDTLHSCKYKFAETHKKKRIQCSR